jgi:CspA family cold shock protein
MRQNGTVKFFNTSRGYGFISPEGGSKDVFVHISELERSGISGLVDGASVSFEIADDERGRGQKAVNIQLA